MPMVPKIPLPKDDRWMLSGELTELFGLSNETIQRWRRAGRLKGYPIGRRYWYRKSEVNQYLTSQGLPTI